MDIIPVLLAGGAGTRLWPLSRKSHPKQFSRLIGETSLFHTSALRLSGVGFAPPLVLTGPDYRFIVTEQLAEAGITPGAVLIEPEGRNTAPAILAAALWAEAHSPGACLLVAPSDHVINDAEGFRAAIHTARPAAEAGQLVTFGITPTRPETGYGYIELAEAASNIPVPVARFVEKPPLETATAMLEAGTYLWNAGMFLFRADAVIAAFQTHAPEMIAAVGDAVAEAETDLDFYRLAAAPWKDVADISIDHAIMEKAENLSVLPYDGPWSDLGDWDAVGRELGRDEAGNSTSGPVTALGCEDTLLRSDEGGPELVGIGLKDALVVATGNAVLVADRSRAQDVKEAVAALKSKGTPEATHFPWDLRPWGRFETLACGPRFQVKRIVVKPGGILSLQSHMHRAEHWVVVEGTARVTIGDKVQLVSENQSVYVPLGEVHRMENPGKVPMVLIEVQTGTYLGEDDITRYEDAYARGQGEKG